MRGSEQGGAPLVEFFGEAMREDAHASSPQAWSEPDSVQAISELSDGSLGCLFSLLSGRSAANGAECRTHREARCRRRHDRSLDLPFFRQSGF